MTKKQQKSIARQTSEPASPAVRKHARQPLSPFGKFLRAIFIIIIIIGLIGVISVGAIGAYFIKDVIDYSESDNRFDLESYTANQNQTSIIYGKNSEGKTIELTRLHGVENRIWVKLDDIPKDLQNAYIALEDKRFPVHHGVDWFGTFSVSIHGFTRGGSSITQQLVKNLTGESGRTFSRKYREIKNALYIEKHYSKDTILEAYLNTLYLDAGCYGVKTAAEYYFGKDVKDLTLAECATIASITKAPRTYNPILNYDNNRTRMQLCLNYMYEQGYITFDEYKTALSENIRFTGARDDIESVTTNETETTEINSYYVDFVIDRVISDLVREYNLTEGEAFRKLYYGGLKVYAAVDMDIQETMEYVYYNRIGIREESGTQVQSAMTVMDYNGRVLGIVGRLGEKKGNRVLNIATDSPRQPGSAIKPLSVYAPAIDTGEYYWSSLIRDKSPLTLGGVPWPKNYGGGTGSGAYLTLPQALAPSYNTIPAAIVDNLGVGTCFEYLTEKFHITTASDDDKNYSALAVGGMSHGVTSLEMTAAYATFGNGGKYYTPWCYTKVEAPDGSILLQPDLSPEQVISEASANVMNHMMREAVTAYNGTARHYKLDEPFVMYAKTGTTTDNYDMWICAGTPYYVTAVWSGYEINEEINQNYFGGSPAGLLFDEVFNRIHEGLDTDKEFVDCEDCVEKWYCKNSGKLANTSCSAALGYYTADNIPGYCIGHYYEADDEDDEEEDEDGSPTTTSASGNVTTTAAREDDEPTTKAPERTTAASTTQPIAPPPIVDDADEGGEGAD